MSVENYVSFVIDLSQLKNPNDVQSDDLGTWKTNGTKTTYFWIRPSGTIEISAKHKGPDNKSYVITRRYYVHGTYQLFRCVISDIKGMFQL